jgi:hypothetical protein
VRPLLAAIAAVVLPAVLSGACTVPALGCSLEIADAPTAVVGGPLPPEAEIIVGPDGVDPTGGSVPANELGPTVLIKLRPAGAEALAVYTAANVGEFMAIAVDGQVVALPVITSAIEGGEMLLSAQIGDDTFVERFRGCVPTEVMPGS